MVQQSVSEYELSNELVVLFQFLRAHVPCCYVYMQHEINKDYFTLRLEQNSMI